MNRYISLIVVLVMLMLCFAGCVDLSLPVYQRVDSDEDGISVIIDGVRYKSLPALNWQLNTIDKIIGYAESYDTSIYNLKNDPARDFIVLKYLESDYYGPVLYRTDIEIPDISLESVDKIVWEDYEVDFSGEPDSYEKLNSYSNVIEDKTTINELLDLLKNGNKTQNCDSPMIGSRDYFMNICLYCSQIPAAYYEIELGMDNGRIVCGKPLTGYVYMPEDLLEKISGKKIDVKELNPS